MAQTKLEMGMKATKLAQAKNLNPEIHILVVDKGGKLEINEEYVAQAIYMHADLLIKELIGTLIPAELRVHHFKQCDSSLDIWTQNFESEGLQVIKGDEILCACPSKP